MQCVREKPERERERKRERARWKEIDRYIARENQKER